MRCPRAAGSEPLVRYDAARRRPRRWRRSSSSERNSKGEIIFTRVRQLEHVYHPLGAIRSSPSGRGRARVVLKDLGAGEYFGELSLFDDKPRSASVETTAGPRC